MTDLATLCIAVDSTGIAKADTAMQGMTKTAAYLERATKLAMAAWGSWKLVQFARDAATLSARYETLGVVMGVVGNNAGYTSQQMENYARALQETGISMVESRNTLAIMAQAHIDLAKATDLAREAQDAAVVGNINSSEAFQRMIYGIQSGQTDVLRTIGINVNFEQSYAKLAVQIGKSTKELTENEKSTARMNAVLERGPALAGAYEASMGTAGKQLLSMKRYADDLQVVLGGLFSDAFRESVYAINQGLIDTKKWLQDNSEEAERANENLGLVAKNLIGIGKELSNIFGTDGDGSWMSGTTDILAMMSAHLRDLTKDLGGLKDMFVNLDALFGEGVDVVFEKFTGARFFGNNDAGLKKFRKGWDAINSDNADYWNLRRQAGIPGNITETGPVGMGLINQELAKIKSAGLAGGGNGNGSTGRDKYTDEVTKLREEYLKLMGAESDAYRLEMEHAGFKGRQLEVLVQEHDRIEDLKQQQSDVAAWEDAYLAKESTRVQVQIANAKAEKEAAETAHQEVERMGETYNTAMGIITPYWNQVQSLAQAETALNQALQDGTITFEAYLVGMQNLKDAAPVVTAAFGDLRDTINNWSFSSTNAFVDFCFTSKASFNDLISSMLLDLARLAMQQNVTTPLAGWLGTLIGGLGSSIGYQGTSSILSDSGSMIFAPRASGGPVSGNTPYIVGEVGPEVFVPKSSGTIVPNNKLGGVGDISVVNHISIARDGTVDAKTESKSLPALGNLIAAKTRETIMTEMRVGGLLAGH